MADKDRDREEKLAAGRRRVSYTSLWMFLLPTICVIFLFAFFTVEEISAEEFASEDQQSGRQ